MEGQSFTNSHGENSLLREHPSCNQSQPSLVPLDKQGNSATKRAHIRGIFATKKATSGNSATRRSHKQGKSATKKADLASKL